MEITEEEKISPSKGRSTQASEISGEKSSTSDSSSTDSETASEQEFIINVGEALQPNNTKGFFKSLFGFLGQFGGGSPSFDPFLSVLYFVRMLLPEYCSTCTIPVVVSNIPVGFPLSVSNLPGNSCHKNVKLSIFL
ncbi:OLC1v1020391C1 [Oldenlandia corymbosa var. corymbosa]|uniref:OLC1v1020391C1 n=1 Tax=Oldenlandia corymbosa var. corymbosa TaxID=529605 RepID=A0AAV1EGG2_OLDCO|nr:OLC1v1020391C1 [Oldenlandia corymbosa var. corymbosa]